MRVGLWKLAQLRKGECERLEKNGISRNIVVLENLHGSNKVVGECVIASIGRRLYM